MSALLGGMDGRSTGDGRRHGRGMLDGADNRGEGNAHWSGGDCHGQFTGGALNLHTLSLRIALDMLTAARTGEAYEVHMFCCPAKQSNWPASLLENPAVLIQFSREDLEFSLLV